MKTNRITVGVLVIVLLAMGSLYAQSQPNSPSAGQSTTSDQKKHSSKPTKKTDENKGGTQNDPFIIEASKAEQDDGRTYDKTKDAEQRAENGKLFDVTLALAIFACLQWLIYCVQSCFMYRATKSAWQNTENIKTHERAYIVCCGLFGVPKIENRTLQQRYRPKASDFEPSWRIGIHNHGRTPGFVRKIQWGMWEWSEETFPIGVDIRKLINDCPNKIPIKEGNPITTNSGEIYVVNRHDVFPPTPTNDNPIQYRYVEPPERKERHVFFAKLIMKMFLGLNTGTLFPLCSKEKIPTLSA